jgi:hypothetical protein
MSGYIPEGEARLRQTIEGSQLDRFEWISKPTALKLSPGLVHVRSDIE